MSTTGRPVPSSSRSAPRQMVTRWSTSAACSTRPHCGQPRRRTGTATDLVGDVVVEAQRRVVRGRRSPHRLDRWRPAASRSGRCRRRSRSPRSTDDRPRRAAALSRARRLFAGCTRYRSSRSSTAARRFPSCRTPNREPLAGATGSAKSRTRSDTGPERRPWSLVTVHVPRVDAGRCIARHGHVHPHRLVAASSHRERRRRVARPGSRRPAGHRVDERHQGVGEPAPPHRRPDHAGLCRLTRT